MLDYFANNLPKHMNFADDNFIRVSSLINSNKWNVPDIRNSEYVQTGGLIGH